MNHRCCRLNLAVLFMLGLPGIQGCTPRPQDSVVSPYAGEETSPIPALTVQEIQELETGAGMGLARAAELNHYPGPRHVLDLAETLALTDDQLRKTQALYDAMQADAVEVGRLILEKEAALDRLFAQGEATREEVIARIDEIAALKGRLRSVHILAHLEMKELLDDDQVARYDELRGYGTGGGHSHEAMHH